MAEEFSYTLKVSQDRIGVLIGTGGKIKEQIEKATKTTIIVDSKEGEVIISAKDGLKLYEAREVIRAIGRGFNPDIAMLLLKTDYGLEVVDISDYSGKNKNTATRLKGRVIGAEGKSKREIERLTSTHISVYGKRVAIVGPIGEVADARKAVESLLEGATHSRVYKFLEKKQRSKHMSTVL